MPRLHGDLEGLTDRNGHEMEPPVRVRLGPAERPQVGAHTSTPRERTVGRANDTLQRLPLTQASGDVVTISRATEGDPDKAECDALSPGQGPCRRGPLLQAIRPQYHWTDQKVHVHTFICLLALLLGRVIEHEARKLKRTEGLSGLLDELGRISLAMVLRASGKKGGRPRAEWQMEEADADLLDLFRALVPDKRPFVYTPPSP